MARTREHLEELLKLSHEERAELAEALLESLEDDEPDVEWSKAWAAEIVRRIERNEPGIPGEQVFAEIRARFHETK